MSNSSVEPVIVQTVSLVGSYLPRRCGIATFASDLQTALAGCLGMGSCAVLAIDDHLDGYDYPGEVRFQIPVDKLSAYHTAAEMLNINQIDAVVVQHEYGIYGGRDGSYVLDFIRRLRMPVLTTLHTILTEPTISQRAVMKDLVRLSNRLVVMSRLGERILRETYQVPPEKIAFIPHGIPDVPFVDPHFFKDQFAVEDRTMLLTFGLLSPGKGIEVAIEALPRIIQKHPEVVYVVLGATHPHLLKREGEAYRHRLERLVEKRGLQEHVRFHNRFVTQEELCGYLGAADIYLTPYPNEAQITSGTLAYALGAGKAVVSTPYWYAKELLADGRGRLVPFNDSQAMAEAVNDLLDNDVERHTMRKRAYMHGRSMVWPEVAKQYIALAGAAAAEQRRHPQPVKLFRPSGANTTGLPDPDLSHLRRLTDDTGIFQHAIYATPDRHHGYCTDDNARALVAALLHFSLTEDRSVLRLADVYLSFLHHAYNPQCGRFRNFMSFDRRWLEEQGSEDVHGRALWALGLTVALAPNDAVLSFAVRLFQSAVEAAVTFGSPRAGAFALVGIHAYLRRYSGDSTVRRIRKLLADKLHQQFIDNAGDDWPWCEDVVTYDNAKLAHALILSGQWLPDNAMLEQGLRSLEWLIELQIRADGTVSLIGNNGWFPRGAEPARFDQQPVEVLALIEACAEAYWATQEPRWLERARQCLVWFLGNNDTQSYLYDYNTGGCRDGLHADGPNLNEGAESTLAWLISLLTVMSLNRAALVTENEEKAAAAAVVRDLMKTSTRPNLPSAATAPADLIAK